MSDLNKNKELTIYLIDDDDIIPILFERIMSKLDHKIRLKYFENGTKALEAFQLEQPDITFLDYHLPWIDGITVLKEIKKINSQSNVIIITESENKVALDSFAEAGADGFISKNFDNLKAKIIELIDAYNMTETANVSLNP